MYETEPVGVGDQPRFLNAAVAGYTAESPQQVLGRLLDIERERGRERPFPGAPRTLDLDLIFYADAIIDEPGLARAASAIQGAAVRAGAVSGDCGGVGRSGDREVG